MVVKLLWLCNMPLPCIAKDIGIPVPHVGGWLQGMSDEIKKQQHIDLTIAFPMFDSGSGLSGKVDGIRYFGVSVSEGPFSYSKAVESSFTDILEEVNPDIVHIHGTEYPHSLAMVNAAITEGKLATTVASIQGLVSKCQSSYFGFIPYSVYMKFAIRELLKKDSLIQKQKQFEQLGQFEIETISKIKHVIGRTGWDRACAGQINPVVCYHHCNETLREEFYNSQWKIDDCNRFSIFFSQAHYPLKGFHLLLEAFPIIKNEFPEAHIYVAGSTKPKRQVSFKQRVMQKYWHIQYPDYIEALIEKYNLDSSITYTGDLDSEGMCNQFLKSHVFVLASAIENSANSLCEAMLLGVPSVASYVGGIMDLLEHKKEGLLYQADAPYMLAANVCKIFRNDKLAQEFSRNARNRALVTHDRNSNADQLLAIYHNLLRSEKHNGIPGY